MLAEEMVDRVEWSLLSAGGGAGAGVGRTLLDLLGAPGPADAQQAFERIENVAFAQDDIYGVAEPTVDVLLAGLAADPPAHVQIAALDALFHIVRGHSTDDPELATRIRERARRGLWLLVRLALVPSPAASAAVELLGLIDPDIARMVEGL